MRRGVTRGIVAVALGFLRDGAGDRYGVSYMRAELHSFAVEIPHLAVFIGHRVVVCGWAFLQTAGDRLRGAAGVVL